MCVSAQALIEYRNSDSGETCIITFHQTGIVVGINGRSVPLSPVGFNQQGMIYGNMATNVSALIPIDCLTCTVSIGTSKTIYDEVVRTQNAVTGPSVPSSSYSNPDNYNSTRSKVCSLCNGKGWTAGCSTPNYGTGNFYCRDCGREVPGSHSHDRCVSCGGSGTR